ncbi:MAG: hypothetical protein RR086_00740, partial [Clostridia bacterium]
ISPSDVLSALGYGKESLIKKSVLQLSFEEQSIINELKYGKLHFNDIAQKTNISPKDLTYLLSNLELKSIICKLAGNYYQTDGGNE